MSTLLLDHRQSSAPNTNNDANANVVDPILERKFTFKQLSKLYLVDESTMRRLFADEPGLIIVGSRKSPGKREYKSVRIPASVVHRVMSRRTTTGADIQQ